MSDSDKTQDDAAMPPASTGSVAVEPFAWATEVSEDVWSFTHMPHIAKRWPQAEAVPLYRQPQPLLTDAEMDAVRFCVTASLPETEKLGGVAGELCRMHAATLRGLLERLGGER